jgi:hypothetical protein
MTQREVTPMSASKDTAQFQRRHYEAIAEVLGDVRDHFDEGGACQFGVEAAADALAALFSEDNPRFDNERFRLACGIVGETA